MSEHVITIDLKGLGLSDEQFDSLQTSLRQAALAQIAALPPFKVSDSSVRIHLGPRGGSGTGPLINGIVVDRLQLGGGAH